MIGIFPFQTQRTKLSKLWRTSMTTDQAVRMVLDLAPPMNAAAVVLTSVMQRGGQPRALGVLHEDSEDLKLRKIRDIARTQLERVDYDKS
ncbi:hypothetical protein TWF106_006743 [Orbilia oligospora]|uniref:Uncharacterized protein n=1 Tax=Orbilia oligospora TaxID=2813651 RepID=A0A7C8QNU9_ORBOL|nr:hypothetical protein TWF106_006743 [Orbilia oligospora]